MFFMVLQLAAATWQRMRMLRCTSNPMRRWCSAVANVPWPPGLLVERVLAIRTGDPDLRALHGTFCQVQERCLRFPVHLLPLARDGICKSEYWQGF
mmetsp:Transcript_13808/g.40302  ORF Transcript_13808/g.40302 Transcript_13808/m.40302 type:complete len:96 (+) Transcript_13808:368-655(+)